MQTILYFYRSHATSFGARVVCSVYVRFVRDGPVNRYHCRYGTRYQRPSARCSSSLASATNGAATASDSASPFDACRWTRFAVEVIECTTGNAAIASSVNRLRFVRQNNSAKHDRLSTRLRRRAYANRLLCLLVCCA